jgi:hypothetical protein
MHRKNLSAALAIALSISSLAGSAVTVSADDAILVVDSQEQSAEIPETDTDIVTDTEQEEVQTPSESDKNQSTDVTDENIPTETPTPTPTPAPSPAPEVTPAPSQDGATATDGTNTSDDTKTPDEDSDDKQDDQDDETVVLGTDSYAGIRSGLHAGAGNISKAEYIITGDQMPGAYEAAALLVENGYSAEAASGIAAALITVNNGHDIPDPNEVIKEILDSVKEKWNRKSDSNTHFFNIGFDDALIDNYEDLKISSAKEAVISFLASYEDFISAENMTGMDYSSLNVMANTVAEKGIKTAYACFRGFFDGIIDEETTEYTSDDIRIDFKKTEKDFRIVKSDSVNIYESPDSTSRVVGTAKENCLVYYIESNKGYSYVESGDVRGFIKANELYNKKASEDVVKKTGEANLLLAEAKIPLDENNAASYVKETVYNFSMPKDEEFAETALNMLPKNKGDNNDWIKNTMDFYGLNPKFENTVLTDVATSIENADIEKGNVVSFENNEDTEDTEDTEETESTLYAVYLGDGKYCTVNADGESSKETDLSSEKITGIYDMIPDEEDDSSGVIINHDVPYYNQGEFGGTSYNKGSVASDGCGLTCFAMIASYATGQEITPKDMAEWAMANGANTVTNHGSFAILSQHYGIDYIGQFTGPLYGGSGEAIAEYLKEGYLVIGSHTDGYFNPSGNGHYIVYTGIDENGNIFVNDPGSLANSEGVSYDHDTAFGHCKKYWVFKVQ